MGVKNRLEIIIRLDLVKPAGTLMFSHDLAGDANPNPHGKLASIIQTKLQQALYILLQ